jgi:predicted kinase
MRGLPSSGKTTRAKQLLSDIPDSVRISKEDMRAMMHKGLIWMGDDERIVIEMFNKVLDELFCRNKTIIIDDTNMNKGIVKSYYNLAEEWGYDFELVEMDVSLEKCLTWDANRNNPAGRENILKMARQYGMIPEELQYVIYGLDNCIADISDRLSHATSLDGSFHPSVFFDPNFISLDKINQDTAEMMFQDYERGYEIVIISSRPASLRRSTEDWLKENCVPFNKIYLRPNNWSYPDHEYKEYILNNYLDISRCNKIVDDGIHTVEMWRQYHSNVIEAKSNREIICQ